GGFFDHVLTYFDGDGWMLSIEGDQAVIDGVAAINFRPGVNWAEEWAGTNGPGTALASGEPVEVFASEHYVAALQTWSCAAAPIVAPGAAKPVGLVDITGPWEVRRRQALHLAKALARAIEERICAAVSVRDEVVRYAFRAAREAGDALVAVDSLGRIIAMNDAATRRRLAEGGSLPRAVRDAIAAMLRLPTSRLDGELRIDLSEGPPVVASTVRHGGTVVGAILRATAISGASRRLARGRPTARYHFGRILGQSRPLLRAIELAQAAARNDLPVVVCGESGTGKELFAQAIHAASKRESGPFVAVNCGSIPSQLVESELFGYEAGSFTGARRDGCPGRFEDADGGTLFLDEVSELPLPAQTALLRVLQEKEVVRLGGSAPRPVDVRVVAATNKSLDVAIRESRFRSDLFYRLNVLSIAIPPLRERGDDVALLARAFLAEAEADVGRTDLTLTEDALAALRRHRWPGNVRELRNAILRAAATAPQARLAEADLSLEVGPIEPLPARARGMVQRAVLGVDRVVLVRTLEACGWNFARAATQLGISRMTLYRWVRKHGIERSRPCRSPGTDPVS
ncbi:MAG TPA: sigma 54-interacting transcriptional regulator, partial [Anaeromyxobacteraceae bacterium]|nr:sigma 54-interacting transcriptional regulator [Anaeromyxobacteraceae bacterium]